MKGTGIFVSKEELETVRTAHSVSGMFLSGGQPMGDPEWQVQQLVNKYHPPDGSGEYPNRRVYVAMSLVFDIEKRNTTS